MSVIWRRVLIWGVLAALLAAGIVYAFLPQPVPVDLATAETGLLRVTIDDEGETRVRDVYTLYAPLSGRMLRITAEAGDPVKANVTQLARIEPAPPAFLDVRTEAERQAAIQAAIAQRDLATADLARAQAELAYAQTNLKRAQRLFEQKTIARSALDEAQRAQRVAEANVATANAALEVRKSQLEEARSRVITQGEITRRSTNCECVPVTAPVSGEVLRVIRRSEGVVDAGTPLLEIGNPRDLEIAVDFLSEDAVRIKPGQKAIVTGWGGPDLSAVVRRIEPFGRTKVSALGIEEQRVDVVLDLEDPPERWRRLGHGYRVDVQVIVHEAQGLKVPLGALFRNGKGWAVFLVQDGRTVLRPVEVGARNSLSVEITSGLKAGDRVVLYPGDRVSDGIAIVQR